MAVKRWRMPQTATHTYYIVQPLLQTCFKTADKKKEEPKAKFNKYKSVCAENCSCAQNSCKIFETIFSLYNCRSYCTYLFVRLNGFLNSDFENNTVCRNTEIVAGSYVRDDELLESLHFSKNLIQVILLKTTQKAAKFIYCHT